LHSANAEIHIWNGIKDTKQIITHDLILTIFDISLPKIHIYEKFNTPYGYGICLRLYSIVS